MKRAVETRIGDILYIDQPKKEYTPLDAIELMKRARCVGICFGVSKHIYKLKYLENAKTWKDVNVNESK